MSWIHSIRFGCVRAGGRWLAGLLFVVSVLAVRRVHGATALFRTWTSRVGTTVEARLVESRDGTATLETPEGRKIEVRISDFSPEDQRFIAELKPLTTARATTPRNLRAHLDTWILPEIRLQNAPLAQAAATLAETVNAAYPDAGLRIRIDNALAGNDARLSLAMRQVKLSEALFTLATVASAGWAVVGNEVVFIAHDDPRAEARPVRANQKEKPPVHAAPRLLRFTVELLSVSARQERQIMEMLPRLNPGQRHTFDAQSDAMKAALKYLEEQSGVRTVETLTLETRSGVNVPDRKETRRMRILAQITPQISPAGVVSADVTVDVQDDDNVGKSYRGQCRFKDDSSQALMTLLPDLIERNARVRGRYVVRVTYTPVK